ncbi:DUF423 domain-containing protein [Psychroflexus lacisalsi]|jgi:hypothetical protein|uniref:DUF423 domain-containing protein n=1 Tax=Psychroflexus lacisalsi TaxID=503928 RepID=A0ABN1KDF0_9FLAO|nr:DUF423 domain-containing protein [Psychroflexus lacisalsi]MBZ9620231.1 DUF423 domain-containing protein [Psychroflexus lacisalsi]
MKTWNFKIDDHPKEVSQKLKLAFRPVTGLVFKMNQDKNSITFKMRRRILYPWYLFFLNSIIVKGKLSKAEAPDKAQVEISFNQHFLWVLVIATDIILGLALFIAVISGKIEGSLAYGVAALILAIGIVVWFRIQKKYSRDVQDYKTLISETLGV